MSRFEEFAGAHERAKAVAKAAEQRANRVVEGKTGPATEDERAAYRAARGSAAKAKNLADRLEYKKIDAEAPAATYDDRVKQGEKRAQMRRSLGMPAPTSGRVDAAPMIGEVPAGTEVKYNTDPSRDRRILDQRRMERAETRAKSVSVDAKAVGTTSGPGKGAKPSEDPTKGSVPGPKPIKAVPEKFAPAAPRTGSAGRVSKQEREADAAARANRTGVASSPRKGTKRGQATSTMGEARAGVAGESKRQQSARNTRYRLENGMGATEGQEAAAEAINKRKDEKEALRVKRARGKVEGIAAKAAIRPVPRSERGATDAVYQKHTPEYHAQAVATKMGVPVEHLHSFITTHDSFKHMTRPDALKALYALGSDKRTRDFGSVGNAQGKSAYSQLTEQAKAHSTDLTDQALARSEGRNRGGKARAGKIATAAHLAAAGTPPQDALSQKMAEHSAMLDAKFPDSKKQD